MKVIDVMNKIANGEEVHFIVDDENYYLKVGASLEDSDGDDCQWYINEHWLNEEVEIIEESKEIEKIQFDDNGNIIDREIVFPTSNVNALLAKKMNGIIDKLNEMSDENE